MSALPARFYAFAFVLLVLAFMGQAQTTRTSRTQALVSAFAVAVFYRVVGIAAANFVVARPAAAPVALCHTRAPAVTAAIAIQWRLYPRRPLQDRPRGSRALAEQAGRGRRALWPRRAAVAGALQDEGLTVLGPRTLRRYVAKRFLLAILGAFAVCAVLIFMIDMIELLRHVAARDQSFHASRCCGWACCACRHSPRSCWRSRCWSAASARC